MINFNDFELENIATGIRVAIPKESINKFNIDDKITPNYNESTGYGKFDPIVVYKNTTRTVGIQLSLKGGIDYSYLMKDFAMITLPKYGENSYEGKDNKGNTINIIGATVIRSAPLYKLNLAGYFTEFGVVKDLGIKPSFESKDIVFTSNGNPFAGEDEKNQRYGFMKLDISFSFVVLHKEVPNVDTPNSMINWPFTG